MSYLELLQQQIQQDRESARRAASVIGSGFESYFQEQERQRQLREQDRERAQKNVAILQQRAESLLEAGQAAEAAKLMPEFQKTVKMGYNLDIPSLNLVGAPAYAEVPINVEAQRPSEKFSGPMPAATVRREVGTTFETPATKAAIRGGFMLKRPEPIKVGSALYDVQTGKFSVPPYVETPEDKMRRAELQAEARKAVAEIGGKFGIQREQIQQQGAGQRAQAGLDLRRQLFDINAAQKLNVRAANAMDNIMASLPPGISIQPVDVGGGKTGYKVVAPLSMSPQAASQILGGVTNMARMQGLDVRPTADNLAISIVPAGTALPRARAQRLVTAEGGVRVKDVPGVRVQQKAPSLTSADEKEITKLALIEVNLEHQTPVDEETFFKTQRRNPEILNKYVRKRARIRADILAGKSAPTRTDQPSQVRQGQTKSQPTKQITPEDQLRRARDLL